MKPALEFLREHGPVSLVSLGCGARLNHIDNHLRLFHALHLKYYVGIDFEPSITVAPDLLPGVHLETTFRHESRLAEQALVCYSREDGNPEMGLSGWTLPDDRMALRKVAPIGPAREEHGLMENPTIPPLAKGGEQGISLEIFKLFPGTWVEELRGIHCAVVVCQRVLPFVHWENIIHSMTPKLVLQEDLHGCELQDLSRAHYEKSRAAVRHYGLQPFRPWRIFPGERNLILWKRRDFPIDLNSVERYPWRRFLQICRKM